MIIHVDMDAFYASVEVREQPALAGRAVIVGGSPQARGVVSAANYAARKSGVHSAMPMARALRLCPQAVHLPVRMPLYAAVSKQIRDIFARYTPEIEPLSLDEAFLDVTASEKLFGPAPDIARRIKQEIRGELSLVASVGIAPSKFVAKIASDIDKPDGFVEVTADAVQAFLDPLPVSRIWGVGKATNAAFERLGIKTIAHLRQQSLEFLQLQFGGVGQQLWELAHGIDPRSVVSERRAKSVSNETTFEIDIKDKEVLCAWLLELTEQVAYRLRQQALPGRTVQIKIRYADFKTLTRAQTLTQATHATQVIWYTAAALLENVLQGEQRAVRLIGVGVSGFNHEISDQQQADLFNTDQEYRQQDIDRLTDQVNARFGRRGLKRGGGYKYKD